MADLNKRGLELNEIMFKETAKNIPAKMFVDGLKTGAKKEVSA